MAAGTPDSRSRGVGYGHPFLVPLSQISDPDNPDNPDNPEKQHSLIKLSYQDPDFAPIQEAAARDVAAVEEDDKYFGADSPANQDEL